jgi:hypothetical protein
MPFPHRGTSGSLSTLLWDPETGMTTAAADHVDHADARAVLEARRRRAIDDLGGRMARLRDETVTAQIWKTSSRPVCSKLQPRRSITSSGAGAS